jgi:lysozyme family protein
MANFEKVYPNIKAGEGDYSDNPNDVGNYCGGKLIGTNHGIASTFYKGIIGRCPTVQEMKNLSATEAKSLWKKHFWTKIDGDNVPLDALAELYVYSTGGGSSGWLHIRQSANKVAGKKLFDEVRVPLSLSQMQTVNKLDGKKMYKEMSALRQKYFENHPNKNINKGLLNRLYRINERFNSETAKVVKVAKENPKTSIGIALIVVGVGAYLLYRYKFKPN